MPWMRTRPGGEDDTIIVVKHRIWWLLGLFSRWEDYSTTKSAVNKIDWELIELKEKMLKLLAKRMALAEAAEAEYRETLGRKSDKFGISDEFFLDDKTFLERVHPYTANPDPQELLLFFNPQVIRKYQLNRKSSAQKRHDDQQHHRAGAHIAGTPIVPGNSGVTAYTLPEFANKSIHFAEESGADQVVAFREENRQSPKDKDALNKLKQKHPRRPDETREEWNERLKDMLHKDQ